MKLINLFEIEKSSNVNRSIKTYGDLLNNFDNVPLETLQRLFQHSDPNGEYWDAEADEMRDILNNWITDDSEVEFMRLPFTAR